MPPLEVNIQPSHIVYDFSVLDSNQERKHVSIAKIVKMLFAYKRRYLYVLLDKDTSRTDHCDFCIIRFDFHRGHLSNAVLAFNPEETGGIRATKRFKKLASNKQLAYAVVVRKDSKEQIKIYILDMVSGDLTLSQTIDFGYDSLDFDSIALEKGVTQLWVTRANVYKTYIKNENFESSVFTEYSTWQEAFFVNRFFLDIARTPVNTIMFNPSASRMFLAGPNWIANVNKFKSGILSDRTKPSPYVYADSGLGHYFMIDRFQLNHNESRLYYSTSDRYQESPFVDPTFKRNVGYINLDSDGSISPPLWRWIRPAGEKHGGIGLDGTTSVTFSSTPEFALDDQNQRLFIVADNAFNAFKVTDTNTGTGGISDTPVGIYIDTDHKLFSSPKAMLNTPDYKYILIANAGTRTLVSFSIDSL